LTTKGETTRLRVLEEAARQAAQRGLGAVSLADVADGAGLSKSGLFKHFDSKEAMQHEILDLVLDRFDAFLYEPALALPAGRARLEVIFDRWLEWGERLWAESGCPLHTFSIELDDQPGPLRDHFQARLKVFRDKVTEEFQLLREPPLGRAEAQAAYFQMKSFLLGHGEARRMMGDKDAHGAAVAAFEALLDRTAKAAA
jgi:AcrR family transcriptional regulator